MRDSNKRNETKSDSIEQTLFETIEKLSKYNFVCIQEI